MAADKIEPYGEQLEKTASLSPGREENVAQAVGEDVMHKAKEGTDAEHNMSVKEAFKKYPKAVLFSVIFSTAIVMEGYDLVMINSFYAQPQFNNKFGTITDPVTGQRTLTAAWQTGLSNAVQVGSILGLMMNGYLTDRFGYRKTMLGALFFMTCFIFITFFAVNIQMLLAGELLCGFPWGVFQTLTVAFASEICPVALRPYLTTYVNLCWVFGQFIASGVLRGFLDVEGEWAYKGPFALQWMWPVPIAIGVYLSPESPWWLVRQGRIEDAKAALRGFTGAAQSDADIERTVAMIQHTNEMEKQYKEGTSYLDCFRGVDLRRTEISALVWFIQSWCGASFMGYSTYFYQQAGLATERAFDMSMVQYALGAIGTMLSWLLMQKVGRRKLYIWGMVGQEVLLLMIGGLGFANPSENSGIAWAVGTGLLLFTFVYDLTVGPVCYCLVAELSSTRLRAKTVVLARNLYNIGGIVNNIITPRQLNPTAWNWGAKAGLFWAGMNGLCIVWAYFRLPEPKGRTYAELDLLFEHKVSARRFASTHIDQFAHVDGGRDVRDEKAEYDVPVHIH